jgi:hypothetical protein
LVVAVVPFLGAAPAAGAAIRFTGTTDEGERLTMTMTATGRTVSRVEQPRQVHDGDDAHPLDRRDRRHAPRESSTLTYQIPSV